MDIIGVVFCNTSKLDIVKFNNQLYCGECLFIYDIFECAQMNTKLIKLKDLPNNCIILFYNQKCIYE